DGVCLCRSGRVCAFQSKATQCGLDSIGKVIASHRKPDRYGHRVLFGTHTHSLDHASSGQRSATVEAGPPCEKAFDRTATAWSGPAKHGPAVLKVSDGVSY